MKCPKDADDISIKEVCDAKFIDESSTILLCTRSKNHKGSHHAHGTIGRCYKVWNDKVTK